MIADRLASEPSSPHTEIAIPDVALGECGNSPSKKEISPMTDIARLSAEPASRSSKASEMNRSRGGDSFEPKPKAASKIEPMGNAGGSDRKMDRRRFSRNLASLDIRGLFESLDLLVADKGGDQLEVECPWAVCHTKGNNTASVRVGVPGRNWAPQFHCFHYHCKGRTLRDVLRFFGPEAVTRFCGRSGQRGTAKPETDDSLTQGC